MTRLHTRLFDLLIKALTIFGLWVIGGLLVTGIEFWKLDAFSTINVHPTDAALLGLIRGAMWAVLTPVVVFIAYRLPVQRPYRLRRVLTLIPVIILLALGREVIGTVISQLLQGTFWNSREVVAAWLLRLDMNIAIVVGLVALANVMRVQGENRERERIATELEAEVNRAQLRQLRADLQPHFLFNALNGIIALVQADPESAERMLMTLSQLLRRSLEIRTAALIPLSEELGIANDYLELMKMRFGDRLTFIFEAGDDLLEIPVPPLLLQPLVENAIKHGALADGDRAEIVVRVFGDGESLRLQVIDRGPVPRRITTPAGTGVGLSSTRRRLELLYGHDAWMKLRSEDGAVVSEVLIPQERGNVHGRAGKPTHTSDSALDPQLVIDRL